MSRLLTLDLSTTSSGYSLSEVETETFLEYGTIRPKVAGLAKLKYPMSSLRRILSIATGIDQLVKRTKPDVIYVEEVNRGIQRISQKSLDALHYFVVLNLLISGDFDKLRFIDSDGKTGWRKILNLTLSKEQKTANKKRKKGKKLTKKHLACDYVNAALGTSFNVDLNPYDNDICDALGQSLAIFKARLLDFDPLEVSSVSKSKTDDSKVKKPRKSKGKKRDDGRGPATKAKL